MPFWPKLHDESWVHCRPKWFSNSQWSCQQATVLLNFSNVGSILLVLLSFHSVKNVFLHSPYKKTGYRRHRNQNPLGITLFNKWKNIIHNNSNQGNNKSCNVHVNIVEEHCCNIVTRGTLCPTSLLVCTNLLSNVKKQRQLKCRHILWKCCVICQTWH